ncbi:MAG: PqqD family peptide modification chaperone, partial [Desulfobacterales bacterium]|nr:PqqD family peptide modification chaperone [Desulfobacterales bacterium]
MKDSTIPIANPIVVFREEFDDWAVLFNPDTAAAVGVNPVGAAIWKRLDGRRGLHEIAAYIQAEFSDVSDSVLEETTAFMD